MLINIASMKISILLICLIFSQLLFSQVLINEVSNKNASQIQNSKGEYEDWIELYNSGNTSFNLTNFYLSDKKTNLLKWKFPDGLLLEPQKYLLVFASGSGEQTIIQTPVNHWETAVKENDTWRWINPDATTPNTWKNVDFADDSWSSGPGGFGFIDNDDNTVFDASNIVVYTRIAFSVTDVSKIIDAVLHVDYDDGFVAYLNGTEIARANISTTLAWNSYADFPIEALMYQGQNPTEHKLSLELMTSLLKNGSNILAIECHNTPGSSDMSLRPFLSFGISDQSSQFGQVPSWFNLQGNQMPNNLDVSFKISSDGETIYLSNDQSQIIDSLVVPDLMPVNYSIGSEFDGSQIRAVFTKATPYASNNTETPYTEGIEPKPQISKLAGIYSNTFEVTITSTSPTSQIHYTIDGQTPTLNSPIYSTSVQIDKTTVLKAISFSSGNKLPSALAAATYIIESNIGNAAVLSISSDNNNFFGPSGITTNWWEDTKVPCYIEYFESNSHVLVVSQNSGIKVDGGAGGSRSQPQTSFRIEPSNSLFGEDDIKYKLIPSIDRTNYETFYIRNGSNQYMYYPCKDAIETSVLTNGTKNNCSAYTPVNVYINGEYWGYYELREKQDADYFKQHYNIDKDDLELLSLSYWYNSELRSIEGDSAVEHFNSDYYRFMNLSTSSSDFWNSADQYFDLEYYTDYICAQSWIADTDWPFNNIKIFRGPETGNKWRFGLVDVEWALNPNGWSASDFNHIEFIANYDQSNKFLHIWQKSMENTLYRNYFINRFADLMNTAWLPSETKKIANDIYSVTKPELQRSYLRWQAGDMNSTDWAHQTMVLELDQRSNYVRQHIKTHYQLAKQVIVTLNVKPANAGVIRISTITPENYPWTGYYFDGIPVKIEAIPNLGYKFDSWDANGLITDIKNSVFSNNINANSSFIANFVSSENSTQLVISEINYNSKANIDAGDWFEIWNHSSTLDANLSGYYVKDNDPDHKFVIPENTIIPANGRIVLVANSSNFRKIYPDILYIGDLGFNLGNSGDEISLFNSTDQLISKVSYSNLSPWPTSPDSSGYTLELTSATANLMDASSWFAGCLGGSPTIAPQNPCNPMSFKDLEVGLDCSVYPNPARDHVNIRFYGQNQKLKYIQIIDMSGKIVVNETSITEFKTLDISRLKKGFYLIKLTDLNKSAIFKLNFD